MKITIKDILSCIGGGCFGWCITDSFLSGNIAHGIVLLVGCASLAALVLVAARERREE